MRKYLGLAIQLEYHFSDMALEQGFIWRVEC